MEINPIKSAADYQIALKRFNELFDASSGTEENDEAKILALLIGDYEDQYYPIDPPDPVEAIKIRMEEMRLRQADLADAMGGKNRVSEILNRKRKLTVEMIRNLNGRLGISTNVLIRDYELKS
jgi:HTH-type transcriptional regulator / antitoxin HigA